jgi:hypothetical protein
VPGKVLGQLPLLPLLHLPLPGGVQGLVLDHLGEPGWGKGCCEACGLVLVPSALLGLGTFLLRRKLESPPTGLTVRLLVCRHLERRPLRWGLWFSPS